MSTAALAADTLPARFDPAAAARVRAAAGGHQRDLRHAGAAAGLRRWTFCCRISMAASIIVFLSAVQIRRAVELSVFPTLLLLLTLFRLALNIASSRRILLHG